MEWIAKFAVWCKMLLWKNAWLHRPHDVMTQIKKDMRFDKEAVFLCKRPILFAFLRRTDSPCSSNVTGEGCSLWRLLRYTLWWRALMLVNIDASECRFYVKHSTKWIISFSSSGKNICFANSVLTTRHLIRNQILCYIFDPFILES